MYQALPMSEDLSMYSRYFSELPIDFERVATLLKSDPMEWIPGAKRHANGGAEVIADVVSGHNKGLAKRVRLVAGSPVQEHGRLRVPIRWRATGPGFLFPTMDGELEASSWNGRATLLCLQVDYTPPLGRLGQALDERVLHGMALSTLGAFRDGITIKLERLAGEALEPGGAGLNSVLAADPTVAQVMTTKVFSLSPTETLLDAANLLAAHRIAGAPVVEGLSVVGILSETDIVRAMAEGHDDDASGSVLSAIRDLAAVGPERAPAARTVADVMTRKVISTHPESSAWEAAALLERYGINRLPVTGALGRLEGVITRSDLLRLMAPSDSDLGIRVRRALVGIDAAASERVKSAVHQGVVVLTGKTRDWHFKTTSVEIVRQIPGVRRVDDEVAYLTPRIKLNIDSPEDGSDPAARPD